MESFVIVPFQRRLVHGKGMVASIFVIKLSIKTSKLKEIYELRLGDDSWSTRLTYEKDDRKVRDVARSLEYIKEQPLKSWLVLLCGTKSALGARKLAFPYNS